MSYVRVGETRIYFEVHGNGPAVVMIPGLATGIETWSLQVGALKGYYQCILIDLRGSGRSDAPDSPYTVSLLAEDVLAVLEKLGTGNAALLGFSFGGSIAQELALAHPHRVKRMVLSNSFARVKEGMDEALRLWKDFALQGRMDLFCSDLINRVFTREYMKCRSREVMAFRLAMMAKPPSAIGLLRQIEAIERYDTRARLNGIECPTLVISASNDEVVPMELGKELALGIPHASFRCFNHGGHALFVEQAVSFNEALINFLKNRSKE